MKKILTLIILSIATFLTFNIGVSAAETKITCQYMTSVSNNIYQYYTIDFTRTNYTEAKLKNVQFIVSTVPLSQGTNIVTNNSVNATVNFAPKDASECPEYIKVSDNKEIISATSGSFKLVSSNTNKGDSNELEYVSCGHGDTISTGIPSFIPYLTSTAFNLLKMGTPIVLIIMGMLEIVKAVTKGTPEDFNKAKGKLFKKFIAAAIVFFIFSITQFVITNVASSEEAGTISECFNCYLNNECDPYVEEI